jgi:hypothetical protein
MKWTDRSYTKVLCSSDVTHLWVSIIGALRRNKSNVTGIGLICKQRASCELSGQVKLSLYSLPSKYYPL